MLSFIRTALVLLMITAPGIVRADVDSVTVTPPTLAVNAKNPMATVSVTWTVNRTETVGGPGGAPIIRAVTSNNAQLVINGAAVATLAGALNRNSGNLFIGQTEAMVFTETLALNASHIQQIAAAAPGAVVIRRMFNDTLRVATADMNVYASLGNAGALTVRRIGLSFENDARTDVVREGDMLRAVADISYFGNGLLRGEWRLVDPVASLGSGTGRVLQIVRQNLVSSGEGRTRIVSPPLPTRENGLYLLSFSVQDTTAGFEIPVLRYFVIEGHDGQVPLNIVPLGPADGAALDSGTVFSWQKLEGANAYQLEMFDRRGTAPLAGQLVPHTELKLKPSALVREDLAPGKTYEWHVRAFDEDGDVVGLSPRRSINVP